MVRTSTGQTVTSKLSPKERRYGRERGSLSLSFNGENMKCPTCGKEVIEIRYFPEEGCRYCLTATMTGDHLMNDDTGAGSISVAHRKDIMRRKCGRNGEVYRDFKKTYILT